ncbi:metal-dependent hydrolase [Gynuella sunshinyii]|uniref:metal-dependent hydrolase n=1 Tax=Gynuella sunshinyii TaxID=1445505 RepID=UPI0009E18C1A|nr:metal-dependent hydrolase [Gynuella sunshinyii]
MFIAHMPAGYLVSRLIADKTATTAKESRIILAFGLFASILPDLDLFYFYLVDNRQTLHHSYWTHIPLYWLALFPFAYFATNKWRTPKLTTLTIFANLFVHLMLDTVTGGIHWGYPITNSSYHLITVPSQYSHWTLNFVFHWSFLFEILIISAAAVRLKQQRSALLTVNDHH